jgi:hypothetical protein
MQFMGVHPVCRQNETPRIRTGEYRTQGGPTVLPDSVGGSLAVNVVILVLADREDVMTFHAVILQVAVFICIRDRFRLDVYE